MEFVLRSSPENSEETARGSTSFGRYQDLETCEDGSQRAHQPFQGWAELWIFTGTRCNLTCTECYTESSPHNDSFRFITVEQTERFLKEARVLGIPKICYTGGEPFYNPHFPDILNLTLEMGFQCLLLTNLTRPYEIRGKALTHRHLVAERPLQIRASLDHPDPLIHEGLDLDPATISRYRVSSSSNGHREYWFETGFNRGRGNFKRTLKNLLDLFSAGGAISVAGRGPRDVGGGLFQAYIDETEPSFRALFESSGLPGDIPLRLFPDIGTRLDHNVPEITEHHCRTLIPETVFEGLMCNQTRMVAIPSTWEGQPNYDPLVFPCTIVPDNSAMALGNTLRESMERDTYLADPRCYRFCISGGASCSEA